MKFSFKCNCTKERILLTSRNRTILRMDEILGQTPRSPINIKNFLRTYRKKFKHPYTLPTTDINIQDSMHLSNNEERYRTVQSNCSVDHLKHPNDARVANFIPGCSAIARKGNTNVDLNTLKLATFHALAKHKTSKRPTAFQRTRDSYAMTKLCMMEAEESDCLQPLEDVIIYVRFYRPTRATHIGRTIERPVFSQEFVCLGRNLLSELRDKVFCVCNNKRFFDVSEDPNAPLPTKDTDPGFFFITDTFYNDNRNPLNMDYSETIRTWAKKAKGLSNLKFKVANLEDTRFIDLTISLGFPQLYQHHGNCEHVFVFSNIQVITNPSEQLLPSISCYPCVLSVSTNNTRACNICGRMNFVFVVEGSNRQLEDPAYLCKQCFISFHYVDGKKIGEFSAYRLIDETKTPLQELYNDDDEISNENINDAEINNEINDDAENFEVFDIIIKEETTCGIDNNSYV